MATAKIEPETHPSEGLNIYQIIDRISNEAGALAPEKKEGVPFPFRGVDGTVAHLSPFLRKYGVVVVPRVIERKTETAPSGNKVLARTTLLTDFDFYAPDGTAVTATTGGEATDYADRSTAQAQSVAFRVALLQTFFLPTQSPEPEQTGVEQEAPGQAYQAPAQAPAEDPIKKGREAIQKLAKEKGIDYTNLAAEKGLTKENPNWGQDLNLLKKMYKLLQDEPAVNPETGEVA